MNPQRIKWLLIPCCCLVSLMLTATVRAQDHYRYYMGLCEQAKRARDFEKMESAIQSALRYGAGDEYAWRSLAWAQGRQGKWKQSLSNAYENIRRNGVCGWSLAQLAESALGNGDFPLARKALDEAKRLPHELLTGCEGALKTCTDWLLSATGIRTYDIQFKVDLKQGGPTQKPVWLLIPQEETEIQNFRFSVRNAVSHTERHVGIRDYIEVVQKPGEPFFVEGTLVLRPFCLGSARLAKVPPGGCPTELKPYLTKFQNLSWWDPELPEVQAIARSLEGRTSAETVQKILNWFRRNIRYDASIKDDPALGQLGTILKLRYGGCHHNSGLFVTLCRAAGVPACVAHGIVLPIDGKEFDSSPAGGHGWAEVYINTIGWVPVEPMDADSLRMFTANRAYVSVGASNRPPENHHFSGSVKYNGEEFRVVSIQSCEELKGRLVRVEMPKQDKQSQ